jgi:CheY-like chemotaxis protein
MRQTQKLESLGVLAGGIAHDFNNLLTAILGNLSLIAMREEEGGSLQPYLANAEATTLRAAELTRQMLAYAGRGEIRVHPLDLSLAASDMASLLKVSISKKVALAFDFGEALPLVLADSAQLQQVVMNLVTNASEAIGDAPGEIRLATGLAQLEPHHLSQLHAGSPVPAGTYVTLSVRDTGAGMSPEVLSRIFDPFFTTKFSGRGLGLSAMLGILRAHGAGIRIQSELGQGSEFRIYFPPCDLHPGGGGAPLEGQAAPASPHPRGTVLVVDDEPEVRTATADLLREAGFEVLEAVDGIDACESYRRHADRIDVVLMDLTMPRMDGRTAALEIMAFDPRARVVLTSGFPVNVGTQGAPAEGLAGFIPKPYRMKDLVAALQRAREGR